MSFWWLTNDFIYGSALILLLAMVLYVVVFIIKDTIVSYRIRKRNRFLKACPALLSSVDDYTGRNIRAANAAKYGKPINLNDFEYEIQNLLALEFGEQYPLHFVKNGKKYKLVFDHTERMVQEVEE